MRKLLLAVLAMTLLTGCGGGGGSSSAPIPVALTPGNGVATPKPLTPIQSLGKSLFSDTNLSAPAGEACITCHSPQSGFADPLSNQPTSHGAVTGSFGPFNSTFGFRNAPSIAYAQFIPTLSTSTGDAIGGLFLDGRAPTLFNQAEQPFLNPFEMANPDQATVVAKVQAAAYATQFLQVFGNQAFADSNTAFQDIATAIAAYEQSSDFSHFNSRYDRFLAGQTQLTTQELRGLQLFNTDLAHGGANCVSCHPSQLGPNGEPPLFTDFSYDNIGVPKNTNDPFLAMPSSITLIGGQIATVNPSGGAFQDFGLENTIEALTGQADPADRGRFRVQSLRNIALTGPYFHNGVFSTLAQVVHFYNVKTIDQADFPAEFTANQNNQELGNLHLSADDEAAIVAFLQTLTDDAP